MSLRIGRDIDGVLADCRSRFQDTARRCLQHDLPDVDLTSKASLGERDVRRVRDAVARTPNWWMDRFTPVRSGESLPHNPRVARPLPGGK